MTDRQQSHLKWWMLPGALTFLVVAYNSPWLRLYFNDFYRWKQSVFGLHFEMNFGTWWSSIIYLLSAAIFYEVACREERHRRPYLELSLLMLAVVIDEVGSLHEWVSGIGGWTALAPFGLLGVLMLGDSLVRLWRIRPARPVLWLVLIGFLVLASVALQEYAEHNLTSRRFSEWYGRFFEETTELVGAWIILFGAVYARRAMRWGGSLAAVVPDPTRMTGLVPIIGFGYLAHVISSQAVLVEVGRWDGSPSAVYPSVVLFLLACYAFWVPHHRPRDSARSPEVRGFWYAAGLFFLAGSIGTMQNLWGLFGRVIPGLIRRPFYEKIPLWLSLLLVVCFIGLVLWQRRDRRLLWLLATPLAMVVRLELHHEARRDLSMGLFALLCTLALMRPDSWAERRGSVESSTETTTTPQEERWKS